jgi:hypothetical protein
MIIKKYRKAILLIFPVIVFLGIFCFLASDALAADGIISFIKRQALISVFEWMLEGLASILVLISNIMKAALALSVTAMTDLRGADGSTDGDAIFTAWKIIRNFVNMAFILMLIVIAFGTIFDTEYGAKNTLGKLIVAALLVNFSLVIGKVVIDISNVIAASFINSFGGAKEFVDMVMHSLQPQKAFTSESGILDHFTNLYQRMFASQAVLNSVVFGVLFTFAAIFAMLIGLIIIVIRIPILWAILIFSPVAWAAFVFPKTRSLWQKWWGALVDWSFVLPIYIFFMYLGIYLVFNATFAPEFNTSIEEYKVAAGTGFLNLYFQQFKVLFTFILSMAFMLGGAFFAKKLSGDAGKATASIQKWMGGYARGRLSDYTGAGVAWKQFKETGKIGATQTPYRGEAGRKWSQAKGSEWVDPGRAAREMQSLTKREKKTFEDRRMSMASDREYEEYLAKQRGADAGGMASRLILAERGKMATKDGQVVSVDKQGVADFYEHAGGSNTPIAEEYTKALADAKAIDKWSINDRKEIAQGLDPATNNYITLRKLAAQSAIKSDAKASYEVMEPILKVLPTPEEREKFIGVMEMKKAAKSIEFADKSAVVSQLRTLDANTDLETEKGVIFEELEKHNPALIADVKNSDVAAEMKTRLEEDSNEEIRGYIQNVAKTHPSEAKAAIQDLDDEGFTELVKKQSRQFRDAMSALRTT